MGLLNVGSRALLANQVALQTVGHNISNVNTTGYSRQTVVLQTVKGQFTGGGYIGKGVDVQTILRNQNDLLTRQSAAADAAKAGDTVRAARMGQIQDIFGGGADGLGAGINDMMNALADVVSAPTDLTARTVFLTRLDETAQRMNTAGTRLDEIQYNVTEEMNNGVDQINKLAPQIAALNEQIANAKGNGQPPNDLLDQRDQLIRDLNQYIQTTQIDASDGSIGVFVAGSQPLVLGNTASRLSVQDRKSFGGGSDNKALYFTQAGSATAVELNESMLGGGEVSALVKLQNGELTEARNLIGRMAVAIGQTLNEQNQRGLTLDGNQGTALFSVPQVTVGASQMPGTSGFAQNTAITSAALYKDPSKFAASDYQVIISSATGGPPPTNIQGSITRLSDGKVMATNVDLSSTSTTNTVDGLQFVVGGTPNAGDQILFKPFARGANDIQALVASPRDLAAANPVNAAMGAANAGSLKLVSLQTNGQHWDLTATPPTVVKTGFVGDPSTSNIPPQVTLTYDQALGGFKVIGTNELPLNIAPPPATYTAGTTAIPYVSGQPINLNGWSISLQGTPKDGDTVTIGNAKAAPYSTNGDNWYQRDAGNAGAMMALRDVPMFDNASLSDGYASLMAQVGTRTQTATFASNLSTNIAASLERERSAVSGVNLDEEAAKLLQYQQAYQASAKMVQIAQNIFNDLIQSIGR